MDNSAAHTGQYNFTTQRTIDAIITSRHPYLAPSWSCDRVTSRCQGRDGCRPVDRHAGRRWLPDRCSSHLADTGTNQSHTTCEQAISGDVNATFFKVFRPHRMHFCTGNNREPHERAGPVEIPSGARTLKNKKKTIRPAVPSPVIAKCFRLAEWPNAK